MSIVAYTGLPRSGKSYTAVEQVILPALRQGRVVVTNLPMKFDLLRRDFPRAQVIEFATSQIEANPDSLLDLCPHGAVVVIDECWRLWPAGKKVDKIPEAFKSFLAEHGHRVDAAGQAQQVVIVTQDLAQIAAFARQLVEQTFRTTKLTMIGFTKKYRTDVYQGNPTGQNPPEALRIRQIFGSYQPRIYQYYVSHTMSESSSGGADERAIDRRGNILLRPLMLAAPFVVIGLVWFGWSHLVTRKEELTAGHGAGHGILGATMQQAVDKVHGVGRALGVERPSWRVTAIIDGPPPVGASAWLSDGTRVVVVDAHLCARSMFSVKCPLDGAWYDQDGATEGGAAIAGLRLPTRMVGGGAAPVAGPAPVKPGPVKSPRAAAPHALAAVVGPRAS